jgi:hypothetical protein
LKEHPAVVRVRERAIQALRDSPAAPYGLATDTHTFKVQKNGKPPAYLLGIAYPGEALVLAIDASEWGQAMVTLLLELGYKPAELASALERAKAGKAALPK